MAHKEKINGAIKYGTRDRNPRRKYEYNYLRCSIPGRREAGRAGFTTGSKYRLFILLLIMSMFPFFISLVIWGVQ